MSTNTPLASVTSVAFASESGIVPALRVVNWLLAQAPTNRVWLFYGHQVGEHAGAIEDMLALKDLHLDRLSLGVIMDREPDEAELLSGRLDGAKVHALASRLFDAKSVHQYFVCGSDELMGDVKHALSTLGVEPARIRVERAESSHVESGKATPVVAGSAPNEQETQVSFVMDGRRRSFVMQTGQESILDAASRAGIELPFSCKAGVCSTCRTKLLKGEVDLVENYALEDWELEQGFILACQAWAKTPELELTYDET